MSDRHSPATDLSDEQLDAVAGGMIFVKIPGMGDDSGTDAGGLSVGTPLDTGLGTTSPGAPTTPTATTVKVGSTLKMS